MFKLTNDWKHCLCDTLFSFDSMMLCVFTVVCVDITSSKPSRDYNSSTRNTYGFKGLLHMLNAIESTNESGFVSLFLLCFVVFIVFSLLWTSKIQVGGVTSHEIWLIYMHFREILLGLCCITCLITLKWMLLFN